MAKRRRFTAAFKVRLAMAPLRESQTARQIGARYGVHPNQVSVWKRKAREGLPAVFERGGAEGKNGASEADLRTPQEKIGQLV